MPVIRVKSDLRRGFRFVPSAVEGRQGSRHVRSKSARASGKKEVRGERPRIGLTGSYRQRHPVVRQEPAHGPGRSQRGHRGPRPDRRRNRAGCRSAGRPSTRTLLTVLCGSRDQPGSVPRRRAAARGTPATTGSHMQAVATGAFDSTLVVPRIRLAEAQSIQDPCHWHDPESPVIRRRVRTRWRSRSTPSSFLSPSRYPSSRRRLRACHAPSLAR